MGLLRRFIRNDLAELHTSNVRVRIIGERDGLDPDIARLLDEAEELTTRNDGLTLVVAFNYGARQEIVARRAAPRRATSRAASSTPGGITERTIGAASRRARHRRTPTSSSAPAASSGCRISCSGRRPTANWCSCRSIGRTSTAPRSKPRSTNTAVASAASAGSPPRPGPDRGRNRAHPRQAGTASPGARAISPCASCSALVLAPLALAAAYSAAGRSRCSGRSPASRVLWEWIALVAGAGTG